MEKPTTKKNKIGRKERTQVVQEPTGTVVDEAVHNTTLTAALEVKHIITVADIAKRLEDRLGDVESNRRKAKKHGGCDGKHAE